MDNLNVENAAALADLMNDTDSENSLHEELPLTVLFKFIRPFNGDRRELSGFLQNGNSAFSLATQGQKAPLLLFVVSQLSTSVVNEVELSEVQTWEELKSKLRLYYSHNKHLAQAHEELEMIKQHSNESITEFFKRVERAKNDCLQAEILTNNGKSKEDLPGLKRSIQQTALRRFIIHCHPSISAMLRAREIDTLNEAFSLALQEEKILNYTKGRPSKALYCSFCDKSNHSFENCNKRKQRVPNIRNNRPVGQYITNNGLSHKYPSNSQPRYNQFSQNAFSQPRYNQAPQGAFPSRWQSSTSFHGNTDHTKHSRPNGDRPQYRSTNDHPRRFYNNEGMGTNPNLSNPRVNNVQSQDLNSDIPTSNVPSENQTIQEAFQTMCLM